MDEDLEREKWILALQSCARKCLNDLDSIPQELEILRYMEKMKEAGKDPLQEVASNHVRYVSRRRGYEAASQKPMQVLKIGRDLSVTRESIKADVFKPWWNLPTRSMDDYAEQEMRHMREVEAAQAAAPKPDMRMKELEEKGLEDDMELVDKATVRCARGGGVRRRERQHEDWMDSISRGIGNTKRISSLCSTNSPFRSVAVVNVRRPVVELALAAPVLVQALLYPSRPRPTPTVWPLLGVLALRSLRVPDARRLLHGDGRRALDRAQVLGDVATTPHAPPPHSQEVVEVLATVLVLHVGGHQVQLVRGRVPLDEVVVRDVVVHLLVQQYRRLERPRPRHVLDGVATPHAPSHHAPTAAQHQQGNAQVPHEVHAVRVAVQRHVEAAQPVA